MSQDYEIRRPHFLGEKDCSVRVVIPSKIVEGLRIDKGDYLKFFREENRIIIEKLQLVMTPKVATPSKSSLRTKPRVNEASPDG